jgi:hypothetical protein
MAIYLFKTRDIAAVAVSAALRKLSLKAAAAQNNAELITKSLNKITFGVDY